MLNVLIVGTACFIGLTLFYSLFRTSGKISREEEKTWDFNITEWCDGTCDDCGNWHCCKVRDEVDKEVK